ncbi:L-asparaginase [Diaporthe helianthi]|uniref:L-asparaginase n=1 Tax=Diaporthe helianthi TaxID=158607 RepID=A0A2P5HF34_DIAHE|nr:L-asparaginase [Diaporthe helianthi]
MDCKQRRSSSSPRIKPRLIIHGGAGNIKPTNLTPERYEAVRASLLGMIAKTHSYMHDVASPSALEVATYAVTLLENDPLFNAGKGAVFTRDGIQQLEASVMVSRGHAKRAAGALGLRHVRNPILLARAILERGEEDLWGRKGQGHKDSTSTSDSHNLDIADLDVPSAQGHTLVFGSAAETLARNYGLEFAPTSYFFTQTRWDEHVRGLEQEKSGKQCSATWSAEEYLPQGTTGAVALDSDGVVCCATSTGGLTNKLTGRVGDTPIPGAGYWAEEWDEGSQSPESPHPTLPRVKNFWERGVEAVRRTGSILEFGGALRGLMADCLPTPFFYTPLTPSASSQLTTTRSFATSGTGNGDSFLRVNAGRTVAAIARWGGRSCAQALTAVTGPGGQLQQSAGDRWMKTGEGEGGMIGIESIVVRDVQGNVVRARSSIIQDHNCPGMFRAWVDDNDKAVFQVWHDVEGRREDMSDWKGEKDGM